MNSLIRRAPNSALPVMQLTLDFDGTLTKRDTLHLLHQAAKHARPTESRKLTQQWTNIVEAYVQDLQSHIDRYMPAAPTRTTIAAERAFLASLASVEARSIARVADTKALKGTRSQDLHHVSADVEMRVGWSSLLTYAAKHRVDVRILSVNWSATFINVAIQHALQSIIPSELRDATAAVPAGPIYGDHDKLLPVIIANELEGLPLGTSTGVIKGPNGGRGVHTSADKLHYFGVSSKDKAPVVYVGDSTTDLECLLAADVGICIRDEEIGSGQRALMETFVRLGVGVVPHTEWRKAKKGEVLLWAGDMADVTVVVKGLHGEDEAG
ncbi:hypothetical protein EJ05DRAFT_475482, partial [Pseudovirgaria hyperparasitica]